MTIFYDSLKSDNTRAECPVESLEAIKKRLDEEFAESCEYDGIDDSEVREDSVVIFKISIDDEGVETIVERIPYTLTYEGERSDYDEHHTI
jgi:hypothetical protein